MWGPAKQTHRPCTLFQHIGKCLCEGARKWVWMLTCGLYGICAMLSPQLPDSAFRLLCSSPLQLNSLLWSENPCHGRTWANDTEVLETGTVAPGRDRRRESRGRGAAPSNFGYKRGQLMPLSSDTNKLPPLCPAVSSLHIQQQGYNRSPS